MSVESRRVLKEICDDYLYILGELSSGRDWKDEQALQSAAATVYISSQKRVDGGSSHSAPTKQETKPIEKKWEKCDCGNTNINFTNSKTNQPYQKCTKCWVYLNPDGTKKPIPMRQSA